MQAEKPPLAHMAVGRFYDPVKAHEYYLRTRKLKGRKPGQAEKPAAKAPMARVLAGAKRQPVVNNPQLHQQRQAAAQRVTTLRQKLHELQNRLKEKEAEQRQAAAKEKQGPTQADKSKKARDDKKYREKHREELKNKAKTARDQKGSKKSGGGEDSIEGIKTAITKVKGALQKAVARQRALG